MVGVVHVSRNAEVLESRLEKNKDISSLEITQRNLDGLSPLDATERLRLEGPNELVSPLNRSLHDIALEVLREPMFLLLIAGGAIYLLLGDIHEALVLLSSVSVILIITIYQERRTERALAALRDLASPRALVIRNGERIRIPGREVVRGDVLVIQEGDRVPADAVLWTVSDLRADESLLTGESVPVDKVAWDGVVKSVWLAVRISHLYFRERWWCEAMG